jgi:diguanylate cyclase (GGDEF)-like protein/PAS domain S-box-containing protein
MAPSERIRLLMIEDVAADAELELRELKRAGMSVEHRRVDTEAQIRAALEQFAPHVIISDFSMPHFDGMAALALARELHPEIPFLFVSGTMGEEYAIRALKNGATDYVLKTNLVRLPAAVERAIHEARDRDARRLVEEKLAETRERLQSLYETMPDMLWSVELPSERLVYASPAANAIYGYPAANFVSDPDLWINVVHPDDRVAVMAAWRLLAKGVPFDVEYRVVRPDGSITWIHDRGRLIRDATGAEVRIDGLARDISDAVRQRERLARLGRVRDLLGAANAACMRIRTRVELFEEFCRIAVARGGFLLARVIELDGPGKASVAASVGNDFGAFVNVIETYNRDPGRANSLLAHALRSGQATVSNDVESDQRVTTRALLTEHGNYSLVILPVRVEGKVTAAAILRAREPNFFDHQEMLLLSEMISNLAFALELQAKQAKIDYLALYDVLTGLPNRRLFMERLTQALAAERRGNRSTALVLIDLERFKAINDTFGRPVGDRMLQEVGRRVHEAAGGMDRVARLGGNLYALMLPDIAGAEDAARQLEQNAAQVFGIPCQIDRHEIRMVAKAGIAVSPEDGADADALFRNAEAALKRAKQTGERYVFYAPQINARVSEQVELESRLRKAVEKRELFLHYQPKVDLATRKIVGLEALMRWKGPDGQLIPPVRFIPILEDTGMILEAGRLALELAAGVYRDWKARGLNAPRIAVNVSALQIRHKGFVDDIHAVIDGAESGVDLEITESLLMQDVDASIRKLNAVREAGLQIALDDFGTGHSSLAYLSRLPINTVKIDRGFVSGMLDKVQDTSIVTAIISLAHALRLNVVAEGVETEEQARLLRLLRCDQYQGYLFSKPVSTADIEQLMRQQATH